MEILDHLNSPNPLPPTAWGPGPGVELNRAAQRLQLHLPDELESEEDSWDEEPDLEEPALDESPWSNAFAPQPYLPPARTLPSPARRSSGAATTAPASRTTLRTPSNRTMVSSPPSAAPASSAPPPAAAPPSVAPPSAAPPSAAPPSAAPPSAAPPSAAASPPVGRPSTTRLNLPPRQRDAMTGSQFIESTRKMSRTQREAAILQEIQKGNVPDFARQMKDITVSSTGPDGKRHSGTVHVMPDYLAIGSNDNFVRIPMDPITAQRIADQTGTSLPTTKMVDDVYQQAEVRLKPQPLPPGAQMMSNDYFERHNRMVQQQFTSAGGSLGQLTAGNQKDLVISNTLTQHPDRVAIYGWHQPNGKPIQPLSTVHENTYSDYSHGVRLVGATMTVDGVERPVAEVLGDPNLAGLISKEGVIRNPRVPIR